MLQREATKRRKVELTFPALDGSLRVVVGGDADLELLLDLCHEVQDLVQAVLFGILKDGPGGLRLLLFDDAHQSRDDCPHARLVIRPKVRRVVHALEDLLGPLDLGLALVVLAQARQEVAETDGELADVDADEQMGRAEVLRREGRDELRRQDGPGGAARDDFGRSAFRRGLALGRRRDVGELRGIVRQGRERRRAVARLVRPLPLSDGLHPQQPVSALLFGWRLAGMLALTRTLSDHRASTCLRRTLAFGSRASSSRTELAPTSFRSMNL